MSRADLSIVKNWNQIKPVHPFADITTDRNESNQQQRAVSKAVQENSLALTTLTHCFSDLAVTNTNALAEDEDFFGSHQKSSNDNTATNISSDMMLMMQSTNENNNKNSLVGGLFPEGSSNFSSNNGNQRKVYRISSAMYQNHSKKSNSVNNRKELPTENNSSNNALIGSQQQQQLHSGSRHNSVANNMNNSSNRSLAVESSNSSFVRVPTAATSSNNLITNNNNNPSSNQNNNINNATDSKNSASTQHTLHQSNFLEDPEATKIRALSFSAGSAVHHNEKLKFLNFNNEDEDEDELIDDDQYVQRKIKRFFNLHDSFPFASLIAALSEEEDSIVKEATSSATAENAVEEQASTGLLVGLLRGVVSQNKNRFQQDGFDLDLTYITPRIIAMGYPSSGAEAFYRNPIDQVELFFKRRHAQHYRIYNLCSEREYEKDRLEGRWKRYPFDDHNAPCPIRLMPLFVTDATRFLRDDPKNVVAIHCKAGKGRTGVMISCLLMALVPSLRDPKKSLHYFASQRTDDAQGVTIASQIRYVHYYGQMLSKFQGEEPTPARSLSLQKIVIWSPIRIAYAPLQQIDNIYLVVEENNEKKMDSQDVSVVKSFRTDDGYGGGVHYVFERSGKMPLLRNITGDIKIGVYIKNMLSKEELFHFWFNTTMCSPQMETMSKFELDKACKDKKNQVYCEDLMVQTYFIDVPPRKPVNHRPLIEKPAPKIKSGAAAESGNNNNNNKDSDDDHHAVPTKTGGNSPQQQQPTTTTGGGDNSASPQQQQQKGLFARLFGK